MRRLAALAVVLASVVGCEALVGISDKTRVDGAAVTPGEDGGAVASGADGGGEDPDVPCAQQPAGALFCDDFDSETNVWDNWSWHDPTNGGTIAFDTMSFRSPPDSAHFIAPQTSSGAQLGIDVGTVSGGVRLAFDLRVDVADPTTLAPAGVAQVLELGNGLTLVYAIGPGNHASLQSFEGSSNIPTMTIPLTPPPTQIWTRIVLSYDPALGATVIEDGTTLSTTASLAMGTPGHTEFVLGAVYLLSPGGAFDVELDNIVIRAQ